MKCKSGGTAKEIKQKQKSETLAVVLAVVNLLSQDTREYPGLGDLGKTSGYNERVKEDRAPPKTLMVGSEAYKI